MFFFSSRRRHTRLQGDWSSTCALPISIISTKRIPPGLRDASRVLDFLGPDKFCEMIDRLPDLQRDLLVAGRSEERRVGKSVDLGGRRIIKKKKIKAKIRAG